MTEKTSPGSTDSKGSPPIKLSLILEDFRLFLWVVWKQLNLPPPTPLQRDMADFLANGPRRLICQAFRGVGKSWMTSAFVCWSLLKNPQLNILVVSASKQRADDFSTFTRRLIYQIPLLHCIRPKGNQRDANISFDVGPALPSHAPSVKSLGITGQMTGSRADIIIADDVEVANNVQTHGMREKLKHTIKEFEAILKPGGRILYLGTPQTEMSIYNTLAQEGYTARIWPARVVGEEESYDGCLAPFITSLLESGALPGTPTEPTRFNTRELLERELVYGKSGFALQFMLDTSLSDAHRYPLKLSDLVVMDIHPDMAPLQVAGSLSQGNRLSLDSVGLHEDAFYGPHYVSPHWAPYEGSVMTIDPSGRGTDETAYCIVKMLKGLLFVTACGGLVGGYEEETLTKLAILAKTHQVNLIQIESNFGDGMFTRLFEPILHRTYRVSVEEVRHSTQKEKRIIDTLEPIMNQHRLIVDRRLVEEDQTRDLSLSDGSHRDKSPSEQAYQLFYQMTRVTHDRGALAHDDRLEALAMAVNYWTEMLTQDVAKSEALFRAQWLDEELQKFEEHALGKRASSSLSWIPLWDDTESTSF